MLMFTCFDENCRLNLGRCKLTAIQYKETMKYLLILKFFKLVQQKCFEEYRVTKSFSLRILMLFYNKLTAKSILKTLCMKKNRNFQNFLRFGPKSFLERFRELRKKSSRELKLKTEIVRSLAKKAMIHLLYYKDL